MGEHCLTRIFLVALWICFTLSHSSTAWSDPHRGRTRLMGAADQGSYEIAKLLLREGADVNARDVDGKTALMVAVDQGDRRMAQLLLERGADPSAQAYYLDPVRGFYTPLWRAVLQGDPASVKLLARRERAINRLSDERTVLMDAAFYQRERPEIIRILLKNRADPRVTDRRGRTALHYATLPGMVYSPDTVHLLISAGAPVNAPDSAGSTALAQAAAAGEADVVNVLLRSGADVNTQDAEGRTPLMLASGSFYALPIGFTGRSFAAVVSALLSAGARLDVADSRGRNALQWARDSGREDIEQLLTGAMRGRP